jgi:capsular exopolysaccharide synthesis family protein
VSRIHDALRRAEEQRLAKLGLGTADTSLDGFALNLSGGDAEGTTTPVLATSGQESEPTDDLLQHCANAEWVPGKDALFLTTSDTNSPGLEEFRSLRSRLFQLRAKRPLKKILISSALPGEGKSFVSANLAQAFARQRGGRTLLIDADLRKPHMHEVLGAPSSPGMYEYLSGRASLHEVIQGSNNDDLFFIPAGRVNSTAAELIGNGRLKLLLDTVAPLFSWIVVDSSPVIPVSDATQVAELCDGVLLVLQAGATPHSFAERAKREFQHASILGVVFNQVARRENPYYKYSYGVDGR